MGRQRGALLWEEVADQGVTAVDQNPLQVLGSALGTVGTGSPTTGYSKVVSFSLIEPRGESGGRGWGSLVEVP